MQNITETEKNRDRIETRTAYVSHDIEWLPQKDEWKDLCCIGAINKIVSTENGEANEWNYYISSRLLTPEELLHHVRMEWSVETMHWLLDVHFDEDHCRTQDKNVQLNLNIARKCAIKLIKLFKSETGSKKPISNIMLDCLVDEWDLLQIIYKKLISVIAPFPDLIDRKNCDIMEWTREIHYERGEFTCLLRKVHHRHDMMNHLNPVPLKW
ncbi:MAG: ISAs1 family transposase [bacterium]|nr:ISAs1 family transposase [bacterium]